MDVAEKTWDLKLYVMDNQARSEADVKNISAFAINILNTGAI